MATLLDPERWYPTSIDELVTFLRKGMHTKGDVNNLPALRKNVAYNLQYTEYLSRTLSDISLSTVLETQTHKSFLVTSAAIIEGIAYYAVYSGGHHKTRDWREIKTVKGSNFKYEDEWFRIDSIFLKKAESPFALEPKFKDLLTIAETNSLLGTSHNLYARLQGMRKLRNKIHLYEADSLSQHDYNIFTRAEFLSTRECLARVLQDTFFNFTNADKGLFPHLATEFT